MTDDLHRAALRIGCDYCHAGPGHWCVTKSGRHAQFLHSDRTWWLTNLYSAARHAGDQEALRWVIREIRQIVNGDDTAFVRLDRIRRFLDRTESETKVTDVTAS